MPISEYEYSYYLDGSDACKIRTENGIIEVTSYEYDSLKRLTSESVTAGSTTDTYTYKYDDYGNRAEMTVTGSENYTTVYSYSDSQGKYKALLMSESKTSADEKPLPGFTTTAEKTTYTYDKNGSQLTKTTSEKTETNTYNAVNQLVGFADGETTASYAYNASGLRYEKTVDGETVHHVWDGNQQIIADVVESQFYEANCYIRGTNLAATYHFQNGAKSDYTYYVQNAHGDVVNLTDADGAVTKTYHYDAFGVEQNIVNSDENAFRYCGEYFDAETGTIYLRARYYNPATGRFISRDSYAGSAGNPLSLNLYTYCANNPVLYIDPTGHSWQEIVDGFCDAWMLGSSGFRDSWNTGIKSLSSGGKASQAFASFSQGVVDTFSSQAVSVVKAVRNPDVAVKTAISDYVAYGKKNPTNWNPANYLGTKIGEGLVSQCQNSFNLIRNNGLNGAAYVLGQTTAVVAETGTSYLAAKMAVEKFATASTATGTVSTPPTLDEIIKNPKVLSQSTPEEIYASLQQQNYTVKPLSRGSLKGIPFEEGGGYKVNFGGDGVFQYHSTGTHHGLDPYYKISTGATGTNRYDLWGNPIN